MQTPAFARKTGSHRAFTLIELLTVITIIMILVGMIIGIAGLVQVKQGMAAAQAQIQGMSTAMESYKVDNGTYPRNDVTDALDPRTAFIPSGYTGASSLLYKELSGDIDGDRERTPPAAGAEPSDQDDRDKSYFTFKENMLAGTGASTYIVDPFNYSFGYSTARNAAIEAGTASPEVGYNPTFDLWSTGNAKTGGTETGKWVKNW